MPYKNISVDEYMQTQDESAELDASGCHFRDLYLRLLLRHSFPTLRLAGEPGDTAMVGNVTTKSVADMYRAAIAEHEHTAGCARTSPLAPRGYCTVEQAACIVITRKHSLSDHMLDNALCWEGVDCTYLREGRDRDREGCLVVRVEA